MDSFICMSSKLSPISLEGLSTYIRKVSTASFTQPSKSMWPVVVKSDTLLYGIPTHYSSLSNSMVTTLL